MPELPDVEVYRRRIHEGAVGRTIRQVTVLAPNMLWRVVPADVEQLAGHRFTDTERVGKWLFVRTAGPLALVLHFGMTGDVSVANGTGEEPTHVRLAVEFDDGQRLLFRDPRMFGEVSVTESVAGFLRARNVGPDALAITRREFLARWAGRRGGLKAALMRQDFVSGLGNLWVDELLFQVGLHPLTRVERLSDQDRLALFRTMQRILRRAVKVGQHKGLDWARLPGSYMLSVRDSGGRCPKDGTPWKVATIAGRTTYWCPVHQRLPRRR